MIVVLRQRRRISTLTVISLFALLLSLVFTVASHGQAYAAGEHLTQISSDPYTNTDSQHRTQVEPDTFAFGNTIVSAFQSGRFFDGGASNIGFATSTNGGKTWVHGFLPGTTVNATPPGIYARASDASVAYDAAHKVWIISFLGLKSPVPSVVDVLVSRSTDGGLTWGDPVAVNATGAFNDKNWSVCDDTPSSPHFGNCYTEFDNASLGDLEQMSTSTDGGLTWGATKPTADSVSGIGGQPVVQPNGTVIVPFVDLSTPNFLFAIGAFESTDGGVSWSATTFVSEADFHNPNPGGPLDGIRADIPLPSAETDRSGKVYVAWSDCRFEASCSSSDIVLSSSSDGLTWSPVSRVPIDPIGSPVDHFIPGLAVDRSTSGRHAHLGLAYYYYPQTNCTVSTCQLKVGFISSTNAGASWSHSEQLAGPMNLTWLASTSQGFMVGDYISTSIVPGDNDATPVFNVAFAPGGGLFNEATYTTPEDLLKIAGGSVSSAGDTVVFHSHRSASRTILPTAY